MYARLFWIALIVVASGVALLSERAHAGQIEVWVAVKDLPAYHLVADTDLKKAMVALSGAPANRLSTATSPAGTYTKQAVDRDHILTRTDMIRPDEPQLAVNTVPVPIPATATLIFGGRLASGDVVAAWQVPDLSDPANKIAQPLADSILVLDVVSAPAPAASSSKVFPYVVVLAVPRDHQDELLAAAARGALMLTLHP